MSEAIAQLTEAQQMQVLLAEYARRKRENKLADYKPYPKQLAFHQSSLTHRETLFRAINQCMLPTTVIETAVGERQIVEFLGATAFGVQSWDGVSRCAAVASPVFLAGIEPAFRVHLASGQAFECNGRHQVLTGAGWSSLAQLTQHADGWRYQHTIPDWTANYGMGSCPCGSGLPSRPNIYRAQPRRAVDVQTHNPSGATADAAEQILKCNRVCPSCVPLPTADDDPTQLWALFGLLGARTSAPGLGLSTSDIQALARWLAGYSPSTATEPVCLDLFPRGAVRGRILGLHSPDEDRSAPHVATGSASRLYPCASRLPHSSQEFLHGTACTEIFFPRYPLMVVGSQSIIAIEQLGVQPIVGFSVATTQAYFAAGVIHHNCGKTYAAAMQAAIFATGRTPDWWPGRRFSKPNVGWVISESMQFSRDNAQRLLLGRPSEWESSKSPGGTGAIPKDAIIKCNRAAHSVVDTMDSVHVRHVNGGESVIMFKSVEVERNKLGGDTIDWAWPDEEPPAGHYEEILTRTNVLNGPVFTTFTPLKGATELVNKFILDRPPGVADICWTIDDENLYTPEQKEQLKAQYANSPQRMARLYAEPVMGTGRVFPVEREMVECTPFEIPDHYARICGTDFGWTHPAALCWWAIDRDTGTAYLYDCWAQSEAQVPVIASAWRARGSWIPVAWPADGDNETAQGSGVSLSKQFREEGMKMMSAPAMLPETGTEQEKVQGRKSVEAQVGMMLTAMTTGKIKVFSTCEPFWREFGIYHRDMNGKIVKKGDDVISGSRYGWIMRAAAQTKANSQEIMGAVLANRQNWRT